jgi:YVTN family beta-propeller protein
MDIAFVSDTKAYVTCLYGNNVTVINPALSGVSAIVKTIGLPVFASENGPVNAGPEGIIISGSYAYTANSGLYLIGPTAHFVTPSVSVINTNTDTIVDVDSNPANGTDTPISLIDGINAQDLDVDSEGKIWVICTGDFGTTHGFLNVVDPTTRTVAAFIPVGGTPWDITIGGNLALIGISNSTEDKLSIYVVRTDTLAVIHDSTNPLNLDNTAGYWTVGKIATSSGLLGYVPAGIYGGDTKLVELLLSQDNLQKGRTFDLAPAANLPSSVGLWE